MMKRATPTALSQYIWSRTRLVNRATSLAGQVGLPMRVVAHHRKLRRAS